MSFLQEAADAVTSAAGWRKTSPDAAGIFRFHLEDDLDMDMLSPTDGRLSCAPRWGRAASGSSAMPTTCCAVAPRARWPLAASAVPCWRWTAARLRCTGLCRVRTASRTCRAMYVIFLNDLVWWKAQMGSASVVSPFSFAGLQGWGIGR